MTAAEIRLIQRAIEAHPDYQEMEVIIASSEIVDSRDFRSF